MYKHSEKAYIKSFYSINKSKYGYEASNHIALFTCLFITDIWYHMGLSIRHLLSILIITPQKIRAMTGASYNAHTEPLFKQLNILIKAT